MRWLDAQGTQARGAGELVGIAFKDVVEELLKRRMQLRAVVLPDGQPPLKPVASVLVASRCSANPHGDVVAHALEHSAALTALPGVIETKGRLCRNPSR